MPQLDLETLASVCSGASCDRKIACETFASGDSLTEQPSYEEEEVPPDFPPESFWLSKDAELDWFDRNAFYERSDSAKASSNSTNLNPNSNTTTNSQRFSLKSKASIIGLPKPQKSCYVDVKNRRNCKVGNTRLFPKRSRSVGKSDAPMIEPSSPKVSCMGRVRSKKDRNRRLRNRQRSSEPAESKSKPTCRKRDKLLAGFRAIFRSNRRGRREVEFDAPPTASPPRKSATFIVRDIRERLPASEMDAPSRKSVGESEAPALGGMKRFASGRRSESWGFGEADGDVAKSSELRNTHFV